MMNVVVLDMQPITPTVGGGRLRILGLYHDLGEGAAVTYVGSYDWRGESTRDHMLTPRLREICIPLSDAHHDAAEKLSLGLSGATVIDSAFSMQAHLSGEWVRKAAEEVKRADVVVFSHPWAFRPLCQHLQAHQLVVYDSQNTESLLKAELLGLDGEAGQLMREVVRNEYALTQRADIIMPCSAADIESFSRMFDVPRRKMRLVPNGTFTERSPSVNRIERSEICASLDIDSSTPLAVFIGSSYGPNVQAARFIANRLCAEMPSIVFLLVGGVGDSLGPEPYASNLRVTGIVDDDRRDALMRAADVAINPISAGSGTNVKMFDYLNAGLTVITTEIGARGICDAASAPPFIVVRPLEEFADAVREVVSMPLVNEHRDTPQEYVRRRFSWESISAELGKMLANERARHGSTRPRARPRILLMSTWNINCGIGEHSSYLADALSKADADVLVLGNRMHGHRTTGFLKDMHYPVVRAWTWDNLVWRGSGLEPDEIEQIVRDDNPDLVIVQHHTAFMPTLFFQQAVDRVRGLGICIAIEFHDARNVPAEAMEWFARTADLIILHDAGELELVPAILRHKAMLQSLPILGVAPNIDAGQATETADGPIIGGFGFLRPYKGLITTIRAIALLRQAYPNIRYRGWHAAYDNEESARYLAQCHAEALRLGVDDLIEIDTGFHGMDTVIANLRTTEVIALPYDPSDEGGSAAANCSLAAGRATVVSNARIFHPVASVVDIVEKHEPAAYAQAIKRLLDDPGRRHALEAAAQSWAERNSYEHAGKRLLDWLGAAKDNASASSKGFSGAQASRLSIADLGGAPEKARGDG